MATRLNHEAIRCEENALAGGKITSMSSPQSSLYDISRCWRKLLTATDFNSGSIPQWNEREDACAELMMATLTYLRRIGCKDIEKLLRDAINNGARQNK